MLADFLTKGVSTEKFVKLRKLCGMDQIVSSEKECGSIDSTLYLCSLNSPYYTLLCHSFGTLPEHSMKVCI